MSRKAGPFAPLLWPVTVPAAFLGMMFFVVTRRHPPTWLLMTFGTLVAVAIVWAVASLVLKMS